MKNFAKKAAVHLAPITGDMPDFFFSSSADGSSWHVLRWSKKTVRIKEQILDCDAS
ncbi:MAG: hypothetical protein ACK5PS_08535 [Desulfopila sp.]